jgi:hypothetical protein
MMVEYTTRSFRPLEREELELHISVRLTEANSRALLGIYLLGLQDPSHTQLTFLSYPMPHQSSHARLREGFRCATKSWHFDIEIRLPRREVTAYSFVAHRRWCRRLALELVLYWSILCLERVVQEETVFRIFILTYLLKHKHISNPSRLVSCHSLSHDPISCRLSHLPQRR